MSTKRVQYDLSTSRLTIQDLEDWILGLRADGVPMDSVILFDFDACLMFTDVTRVMDRNGEVRETKPSS